MTFGGNSFNDFPENELAKFGVQGNFFIVQADLPERFSISVPAVIYIYRTAVPAQKYLLQRRSAAFRHHYTYPAFNEDERILHFRSTSDLDLSPLDFKCAPLVQLYATSIL